MGRLLIVSMLFLTACHSGWNKDPFDGQDDRIKNAVPPDTKQKKYPPPDRSELFPILDRVHSVKEGETLSIFFDYREGHPEVKFSRVEIKDLQNTFPNSSYDSSTRILQVTPDLELVPVDRPYILKTLSVSYFSTYGDQEFEAKEEVTIHVLPENSMPPIIREVVFQGGNDDFFLGRPKKITVFVEDSSSEYSPRLMAFDSPTIVSIFSEQLFLAPYFEATKDGTYDDTTGLWKIEATMKIPSRLAGLSNGRDSFEMQLYAFSVNGVPSRSEDIDLDVWGEAIAPRIPVPNTWNIQKGRLSEFTFPVVDPFEFGDVRASCENEPVNLKCVCGREGFVSNGKPAAYCTIEFNPMSARKYDVTLVGTNTVRGPNGTTTRKTTRKTLTISVKDPVL